MRILGIAGSLRRGSHNRRLLRAAGDAAPARGRARGVGRPRAACPPSTRTSRTRRPRPVQEFLDAIEEADALLIATPEYNASLPGALKNALDWASRPFPDNVLRDKPAAVIGASTGLFGAVWAQAEVRKVLKASGAHVLEAELPVGMADCAFADDGALADPELTRAAGRPPRRPGARGGAPGRAGGMIGRRARAPARSTRRPTPRERADAARNRARILAAAARAGRRRAASSTSRWRTSRARRGVGTGTLYRRFGDRAGLALALLDEHTREFQDALISGPPPLGPGAPAAERLRAFGERLPRPARAPRRPAASAAAPPARDADGPLRASTRRTWRSCCARRRRTSTPSSPREALLATLRPAQHLHARRGLGWPLERLREGWGGAGRRAQRGARAGSP